ncbi:uncharacterized protein G2W53_037657 [Senna tora]|uniref:Uncharacterized protein n=1 Tax=Senna tora TaxID=362788 RepID=A0A834SLB3_9FABA|nr:uncharacterized protein G2W53_037657 [Senna tora]
MVGWSNLTAQRAMGTEMEAHVEGTCVSHQAHKALGPTNIDSRPRNPP